MHLILRDMENIEHNLVSACISNQIID
jgi:hypothetical protein